MPTGLVMVAVVPSWATFWDSAAEGPALMKSLTPASAAYLAVMLWLPADSGVDSALLARVTVIDLPMPLSPTTGTCTDPSSVLPSEKATLPLNWPLLPLVLFVSVAVKVKSWP